VFKDVPSLGRLCAFTGALIREALGTGDPVTAQFELDKSYYLSRVEALQKRSHKDDEAKTLFLRALAHVGVNLRRTYWDWLYLRVSPHSEEYASRRTARLGFDRDT
jgi:hypothetical protein